MERKKGRLAFWTKCFHCNKDVYFFRDDNDGSAVFGEPSYLWIKSLYEERQLDRASA